MLLCKSTDFFILCHFIFTSKKRKLPPNPTPHKSTFAELQTFWIVWSVLCNPKQSVLTLNRRGSPKITFLFLSYSLSLTHSTTYIIGWSIQKSTRKAWRYLFLLLLSLFLMLYVMLFFYDFPSSLLVFLCYCYLFAFLFPCNINMFHLLLSCHCGNKLVFHEHALFKWEIEGGGEERLLVLCF